MSSKWIAAAVTAALATGVLTAGVSGATPRPEDDNARTASSAPAPEPDATTTDTTRTVRESIGPLGRVLTSVDALIAEATGESGARNPQALQQRLDAVDAAAREMRAAYAERLSVASDSPKVPFARGSVQQSPTPPPSIAADDPTTLPADETPRILPAPAGEQPRTLPAKVDEEPRTLPAQEDEAQTQPAKPQQPDLRSALAAVLESAETLVQKAQDPSADETEVRKAAQPISRSAIDVITAAVSGLGRV